jgi:hypothetical protein
VTAIIKQIRSEFPRITGVRLEGCSGSRRQEVRVGNPTEETCCCPSAENATPSAYAVNGPSSPTGSRKLHRNTSRISTLSRPRMSSSLPSVTLWSLFSKRNNVEAEMPRRLANTA